MKILPHVSELADFWNCTPRNIPDRKSQKVLNHPTPRHKTFKTLFYVAPEYRIIYDTNSRLKKMYLKIYESIIVL